jgi:SAM-dependent methyltransferase
MDTAVSGLKRMGCTVDEIDPLLNYDLDEFMHKPSTKPSSYDIIVSTSVIEHVKNDELFLKQIAELLSPGGIAVLTCDYNDQYKNGDPIPSVDYRFYTQADFKERLLPKLPGCSLIDTPQWDCPDPDFIYERYRYTFATLVFKKDNL